MGRMREDVLKEKFLRVFIEIANDSPRLGIQSPSQIPAPSPGAITLGTWGPDGRGVPQWEKKKL